MQESPLSSQCLHQIAILHTLKLKQPEKMSATGSIKDSPLSELLSFGPVILQNPMTREEFIALASRFPDLRMERDPDGKVMVMTPVKKGPGKRESILITIIGMWALQNKNGEVYSSATGIELPSGAIKSPDCAWVSSERLTGLPATADEEFLKVIPDFVVELRSDTDRIAVLKKKMTATWMQSGVRLAWLIDPYAEKVWVYREGQAVEEMHGFTNRTLNGETVMPGLEFPLELLKK